MYVAEFGQTLKYVGLSLLNSGEEWTAAGDFDAHWRRVTPPNLPVWGVGCGDRESFAQFLIYCRYLDRGHDTLGRVYYRPTLMLKLTLAIAFPSELAASWPADGDWELRL